MGTSPESYGTGNIYEALSSSWAPMMAQMDMSDVEQFTRFHTYNVAAIRRWSDLPIGRLASGAGGSGAISAQAVGATGQQVTPPPGNYALKVAINNFAVVHNPQIVDQKVQELSRAVQKTTKSLIYAALNGGFTTTYPDGAGSTAELFNTSHRYAGAGDADGVLDQTQSHVLTADLSYDSLNSAITLMQDWKDQSGEPVGLGRGGMVLIVPTNLRATAINLTGGTLLGSTSASNVNPNGTGEISVVSSAYLSALDVDNWFLCETAAGGSTPVNVWTSGMPSLNIPVDEANLQTVITAAGYMKAWIDGPPAGIVGSSAS